MLFKRALRPGELLSMTVSSVEFRKEYCVISVKGKTGLKPPAGCSIQAVLVQR